MIQTYGLYGNVFDLIVKVQRDFPEADIYVDYELAFYEYMIPKLESKQEILTVRFKKDMIRIPRVSDGKIPLVAIQPDKSRQQIGYADLGMLVVAHVRDFPLNLIRLDEYRTKRDMVEDISRLYGHALQPQDIISGYLIAELHMEKVK